MLPKDQTTTADVVCWKFADDFTQWWADVVTVRDGEGMLKDKQREENSATEFTTEFRIESKFSLDTAADTVEQITCPSLVEVPSDTSASVEGPSDTSASVTTNESKITPKIFPNSPYFSICASPKGGMGALALCDIPESTDILEERALLLATDRKGHLAEELDKLSMEGREAFSKLACFEQLDADKDVAIFKTNRFRTGSSSGIFLIASRFNHACNPSISYGFDSGFKHLVFTTRRDIKVGEELTIMYSPNPSDLSLNYGFQCDCGSCHPPVTVPVLKDRWADSKILDGTSDW